MLKIGNHFPFLSLFRTPNEDFSTKCVRFDPLDFSLAKMTLSGNYFQFELEPKSSLTWEELF